ncbi:serine protease grass-like [Culex quinquefasciatus]|uniref:serine protease grass-like n=1 Tax=Culex quinquefasciatus TaxID=7176 RepID=UPI0018E3615B|nr:serine protease grass-like [Culex quinquefasciatus]
MITGISYLEEIKTLKNITDQLMPPSAPDYASRLPKQCGNFIPSRVYDDLHSEVYEFPWIALVGYRRLHYTYRPYFSCTGTLINRRYVLTSGACVSHGKINVVRLGEQEIGNDRDCDLIDENDCALVVQDFDVEYLIKHHSHDIGLIRLAGNVVYEDHIQPVCLPVTNELQNQRPALYFVTGYGGEPLGAAVLYNGYRFVQFGIRTQVNRCDSGAAIYLNVAYFLDWIMFSMEAKDFAEPEFGYQ